MLHLELEPGNFFPLCRLLQNMEREKSDVAKVLRALSKLLRDFIRALLAGPLEDVSQRAQIMSLEDRIIYAELGRRQREWVDGESVRR